MLNDRSAQPWERPTKYHYGGAPLLAGLISNRTLNQPRQATDLQPPLRRGFFLPVGKKRFPFSEINFRSRFTERSCGLGGAVLIPKPLS